ncbi:hypothetical protein E5E97_20055 [Aeromonas sp. 2692-1]|uniref:hypothetical protein n=1 Tax=Aeromonas sp. 2692-1 TaxID=2560029 RepID=UPI00148AE9C4|nr:hypothetical protein [Aeromonas sp. 2692-1]QJT14977.1 hypothetical protein E5E97_20055 [Aeromonas sp. 2692-1]
MNGEYQRRMMNYVKANHPCYPRRKHAGMDDQELAELEQQADANAMAWLDEWMPRWREGNPPTTNQIYVTITKKDEEEDDDQ